MCHFYLIGQNRTISLDHLTRINNNVIEEVVAHKFHLELINGCWITEVAFQKSLEESHNYFVTYLRVDTCAGSLTDYLVDGKLFHLH